MWRRWLQSSLQATRRAVAWKLDDISPPSELSLFHFTSADDVKQWQVYSDAKHGGQSSAELGLNSKGNSESGVFSGNLSSQVSDDASGRLKRSGFVGIRTVDNSRYLDLEPFESLVFRVRGDGRCYISSLRTDSWVMGPADGAFSTWQAVFLVPKDEWITVKIPLARYVPTWRGKLLPMQSKMNRRSVTGLGISTTVEGTKEAVRGPGDFRLEIEWIKAAKKYNRSAPLMAQTKTEPAGNRRRLLSPLGRQLIRHVQAVSLLCYIGGLMAVLLLPLLAKNTYIDENALMPGTGNPAFANSDVDSLQRWAAEVTELLKDPDSSRAIARWMVHRMRDLGADCYLHPFDPPKTNVSSGFELVSHHFKWTKTNQGSATGGKETATDDAVNVVGIVRAPQGDGNEAIVLVTPVDVHGSWEDTALSVGLGVALFARLSKALWLARDIVFVAADAKYGAYFAVAEWLKEYHNPALSADPAHLKAKADLVGEIVSEDEQSIDGSSLMDFKRAGTIATGLVFDISSRDKGVKVRTEGPNGQMPNLDLINVLNSIAVWREDSSVQLEILTALKDSDFLNGVGRLLESIGGLAKQLSPSWDFRVGAAAYPKAMATLLSSMFFQVLGLSTGAHGAFRDYQIDAISVHFSVTDATNGFRAGYALFKYGRLLESVVRSANNLLEKWHHSFFLYFLSSTHKYISVGVYMQPFALLLVGLPLTAAVLCFPVNKQEAKNYGKEHGAPSTQEDSAAISASHDADDELDLKEDLNTGDDLKVWWQALLLVGSVQLWSLFMGGAFYFILQIIFSANQKLFLWVATSVLSLKVLIDFSRKFLSDVHDQRRSEGTPLWVPVKALTAAVTSIGLGVMSTINYAVALAGALILVPMCISISPFKVGYTHIQLRSAVNILSFGVGIFFTVFGSLPCILGLLALITSSRSASPSTLWHFMEALVQYRSALPPYLLFIHLPCSVLCLRILFSSSEPNVRQAD